MTKEVLEKVERLLRHGVVSGRDSLEALACIADECNHTKEDIMSFGESNVKKLGQRIEDKTRVRDLDDNTVYTKIDGVFYQMPDTNEESGAHGKVTITYRVPPKKKEGEKSDKTTGKKKNKYTWEGLHDLSRGELKQILEDEDLGYKCKKSWTDEELADRICESLKIEEPEETDEADDDDVEAEISPEKVMKMGRKELKALIKSIPLDIDPDEYASDKKLAKAVVNEIDWEE
jgi:hypothetical protein